MSTHDCPSEEQLRAFAMGELGGSSVEEAIVQVDHCTRCQPRFESLEDRAARRSTLLDELRRLRDHRYDDAFDTPDDADTPDDVDTPARLLTRRRPVAKPARPEPPPGADRPLRARPKARQWRGR